MSERHYPPVALALAGICGFCFGVAPCVAAMGEWPLAAVAFGTGLAFAALVPRSADVAPLDGRHAGPTPPDAEIWRRGDDEVSYVSRQYRADEVAPFFRVPPRRLDGKGGS